MTAETAPEPAGTTGRLNGVITALDNGGTAYIAFSSSNVEAAVSSSSLPHDGVIVEMEHTSFSARTLQDYLHYLVDRRQVVERGLAPAVTPLVRVPVNGAELNQWMAKQVLDSGAFGVVWPHIDSVEEAANAVAACRYPTPGSSSELGVRGCAATAPARYFGLTTAEYYERAGVWPLDADGEILVVVMIESKLGVDNIEQMLGDVPGIGAVFIGRGDLSRSLGCQGQPDHPDLRAADARVVAACRAAGVACGGVAFTGADVDRMLEAGQRFLVVPDARLVAERAPAVAR